MRGLLMAKYVVVWGMLFVTFMTACIISPDEWLEYLIGVVGLGLWISFLGSSPDHEQDLNRRVLEEEERLMRMSDHKRNDEK